MLFRYRSRNTETQSRSSDVAYSICGIAAPWHCGPVALWPRGIMAPWHCGPVALWPRGIMTPWHCGLYPLSSHLSGSIGFRPTYEVLIVTVEKAIGSALEVDVFVFVL